MCNIWVSKGICIELFCDVKCKSQRRPKAATAHRLLYKTGYCTIWLLFVIREARNCRSLNAVLM
jgi:hypothetical protein